MPHLYIVQTDDPNNILTPMQIGGVIDKSAPPSLSLKMALAFMKDITDNLQLESRSLFIQYRKEEGDVHVFIADFPVSVIIKGIQLGFELMGPMDLDNKDSVIATWRLGEIPDA